MIHATVTDAARQLGGSEEPSAGLRDRRLEHAVDWHAGVRLGGLGLDALDRTRGHRDVVVLGTGPRAGGGVELRAVWVDRQQETVAACLRALPAPLRHPIERAGPERDAGIVRAIAAADPWAELVSERFPGARASRDGADTMRQTSLQRLTRVRPKAADDESTGARWPFRRRPAALQPAAGTGWSGFARTRPRLRRLTTDGTT